jgi:protein-disulfide isomerase
LDGLIAVSDDDHVLGAAEPALTLIEYGDFGCPFCFAAKRPIGSLLKRYDAVRLVWRHAPNAELHPGADLAAELSELAAVHGRFWDAHDLLLSGRSMFTRDELDSAASELGLDPDEVATVLNERRFRGAVDADLAAGAKSGIHGTPTFFLNGERLDCHWHDLAKLVPRALAESKQRTVASG